jgi:hypothetical protein
MVRATSANFGPASRSYPAMASFARRHHRWPVRRGNWPRGRQPVADVLADQIADKLGHRGEHMKQRPPGLDVSMPWCNTSRYTLPGPARAATWIRCRTDRPIRSSLVTSS